MNDTIEVRVTVTGTYEVKRSDLPEYYGLPADAPAEHALEVDRQQAGDDPFMALSVMDEGTEKVTFEVIQ